MWQHSAERREVRRCNHDLTEKICCSRGDAQVRIENAVDLFFTVSFAQVKLSPRRSVSSFEVRFRASATEVSSLGDRKEGGLVARRSFRRLVSVGRVLVAVAMGAALITQTETLSRAQDVQSAMADISESADFRLRVSAALLLGRAKPPGAREKLEHALGDAHPAVRLAAAAGLSALGDPAAIPALERRAREEQMVGVKAKMQESAQHLRPVAVVAAAPRTIGSAKYVLELGTMHNASGVPDAKYSGIMAQVAKRQLESKGAMILEAHETALHEEATKRKIPVYRLEGQLSRLSQQQSSDGSLTMQARVEFSVLKVPQHTLQGTLSGAASTQSSSTALGNPSSMSMLREQVIGGAVESAMQNADRRLLSTIH
jgi:hypothetical protein